MKEILDSIREYLTEKGNYKESDEILIDKLPFAIKVMKDAQDYVEIEGIMLEDNKGNVRKNPALEVYALYLNKIREYMTMLGMTPRERRKMEHMMAADENDGFSDDDE